MANQQTILVIDDQIAVCRSVEKVLQRQGYRVESFLNGREAMERIGTGGVDLIVSDLMMPERTGTDLLRQMHALGITIPLVIITGYAGIESSLESLGLGAMDYLPKPFTIAELRTSVQRALRGGRIDPSILPRPPRDTYAIRRQTWARRIGPSAVLVGVHPFRLHCCGAIQAVDLAHEKDEVVQGGCFGKLTADDSAVPAWLWSPVSGEVAAVNSQAIVNPGLLAADPYGQGWLMQLTPYDLDKDLKALVAISAA
ncbi:MAG: response regulator [bacterium]|nr:response regulator [bacterium]